MNSMKRLTVKIVSEYTKVILTPKKKRCGVARPFNNKCRDSQYPHAFLKIQPIQQFSVMEESKLDDTFGSEKNIGKPYSLPTLTG